MLGLGEQSIHLPGVIFVKLTQRENIPINGMFPLQSGTRDSMTGLIQTFLEATIPEYRLL